MSALTLTYAAWKSLTQSDGLGTTYQTTRRANRIHVWSGNGQTALHAIVDADDYSDWDTDFSGEATLVSSETEAMAVLMDLQIQKKSRDGNIVYAPTFEDTMGLYPEWAGHLYTATAGTTNIFDEVVTTEKQLRGGWYELFDSNAVIGDYLEFAVVDKDDVLGLFSLYGMTVGTHVLELAKYVKTEYINPSKKERQVFMPNSTFVVTAGLYLRTIYESTGQNNVQFKVDTHVFH